MSKNELVEELQKRFRDVAQVHSLGPYKIEMDVSTEIPKEEWLQRLEGLDLKDNSNRIPDSWKYNEITIQFFHGNISIFKSKNGL